MQASFLSQLIQRLGSKSPAFFRKLQYVALVLAGLIWLFNALVSRELIDIPNQDKWVDFLNSFGGGALGLYLGAKSATTNPDLVDKEVKREVINEAQND